MALNGEEKMVLNNKLYNFFNDEIFNWVAKNFGTQEAEDPSWSIEDLSAHLASVLMKKVGEAKEHELVRYELTLLMNPALNVVAEREKIEAKLREFGGSVVGKENEGVKTLAYKINGMERAEHSYWEVLIPKDKITAFTGYMNITDSILRWLFIKKDERERSK